MGQFIFIYTIIIQNTPYLYNFVNFCIPYLIKFLEKVIEEHAGDILSLFYAALIHIADVLMLIIQIIYLYFLLVIIGVQHTLDCTQDEYIMNFFMNFYKTSSFIDELNRLELSRLNELKKLVELGKYDEFFDELKKLDDCFSLKFVDELKELKESVNIRKEFGEDNPFEKKPDNEDNNTYYILSFCVLVVIGYNFLQ